jgi:glycosyltransferase involved in cell wall biosynthesis
VVLDEFNAEYVLQRRAAFSDLRQMITRPRLVAAASYSFIQWRKLATYEQRLLRRYDRVLAVSEHDRRALRKLVSNARIAIVPNGVDTDYFSPQFEAVPDEDTPDRDTEQPTGSTILFTGSLDFRPNIDAVLWFSRMVLPLIREHRPEARFLVVGRQPAPAVQALHNNQSIIVRPDVADVRPSIAAADVYVVPMRMGGGVRLKLLEALAMQAPVVSTKMGAEGVQNLDDHEHLLLADTPSAFAAATLRLLDDPALGKRLGSAGRELVAAYYDWREIVPQLEQVYCSLPV